ncbi:MAG: nitrous oxide reductase family maturation protein NosD, partial [Thermomicrobiaceae bacterium]|nr:nitrous oxide reductase family maturation protein NosD [Thermomicrobiaceae bacterium]
HGTALDVAAPDVTIQGFAIRGTGTSHDHEDSAIRVNAARATIVDNQIDDALFGIYLKNGHGSVLRGNVVRAKPLPLGERGDGIRVWYSNGVTVEDNIVHKGRDVILWFSHDAVVRHNTVDDSRYGLHLMYSDRTRIEENALRSNLVGLYIMYSRDDLVRANAITDNRGPSGLGIGLKGVDDGRIEANRIVGNQIGVQVDESPHDLGAGLTIAGNVVAYNGVGIAFLPNVRRNTVVGNDFLDNMEQVAILGGGSLRDMTWTEAGRGNYWSDYAGYDADGDGVGDLPYQSRHLFESLMDQHEQLRLFLFSPAATAIDFAARAFPEVRPETKLVDGAPLMHPVAGAGLAPAPRLPGATRLALGSISFIVSIGGLAMVRALRR